MNAYCRAWDAYHAHGEPTWAFHEVLAEHLRRGAVVVAEDGFVLARRVAAGDSDEEHLSPLHSRADGNCWMVWLAAGSLPVLLRFLETHPLPWVSFTRRGKNRVRRVETANLFRHVHAESTEAEAAAGAAAARVGHGAGKDGGGTGGPAENGQAV